MNIVNSIEIKKLRIFAKMILEQNNYGCEERSRGVTFEAVVQSCHGQKDQTSLSSE